MPKADARRRTPSTTIAPKRLPAALDRIRRNISRYVTLTEDEFQYFASLLLPRRIRKKERLLAAGEVCWFEGFVHTGCMRVYCTDAEGADHILCFAPEDSWFVDVQSFISIAPAKLNIDALETSEVLLIERPSEERLFIALPKFERSLRLMTQWSFVALQERLIGSMALTAAERYRDFTSRHPGLVNRIPQYQIAAYLGISPEFLSKIRRPPPAAHHFRKR